MANQCYRIFAAMHMTERFCSKKWADCAKPYPPVFLKRPCFKKLIMSRKKKLFESSLVVQSFPFHLFLDRFNLEKKVQLYSVMASY